MAICEREILDKLANAVINGNEEAAKKVAEEAITAGIDAVEAINEGLAKGMNVVGERFEKFEIFLPEILLAAEAMKAGVSILKTKLSVKDSAKITHGKVLIGTVKGDIHDIGKNIVIAMLSAAGYEVHDLGCDVDSLIFIDKAKELSADIIGLSSLISPSLYYQKEVITLLEDMGIRDDYHIMVGGGVVTPHWTEEIRADGYGRLSEHAVEVANMLMVENSNRKLPVIKE